MFQTTNRFGWRKILGFSACFLLTALLSVSCKKNASSFGTDALSPEDLLASGGVDTFGLVTYSVPEDSFPTDNQLNAVLGSMHDPKMGIVNAAFYTQFDYDGAITHDGGIVLMDSVVLSLHYSGSYGKMTPQTFQVFQLTDPLHIDSTYYKNDVTATSAVDLVDPTSALQTPAPNKDVVIADPVDVTDTLDPQLRLRLDNGWGFTFMDEIINGSGNILQSTETFQTYFKGLKVRVQETNPGAGTGGILYFDLNNSDSKLTFYYHLQGETDAYNYSLIMNSECADYNEVDVDNSNYPVEDLLADQSLGKTQFYAQAFETRAVVEFPSVGDLPDNTVIHAALLELPFAYQNGSQYYPSVKVNIIFESKQGTALIGAIVDNENKRYVVDVRDYVQEIVNGDVENTGIFISPTFFTATGERIIFNGSETSYKTKPKLIVKYTTF